MVTAAPGTALTVMRRARRPVGIDSGQPIASALTSYAKAA